MPRLIFHIDVNSAFLSWEATRRVGGAVKDLLIAGIGGQQTALDGALQQKGYDDTVHSCQIAGVEFHAVASPEGDGAEHDHERQLLKALAAWYTAFVK